MKARGNLKVVGEAEPAAVPAAPRVVDIYTGHYAKIADRDWGAIHVAGDRREPVNISEPRLGRYRGIGSRVQKGREQADG